MVISFDYNLIYYDLTIGMNCKDIQADAKRKRSCRLLIIPVQLCIYGLKLLTFVDLVRSKCLQYMLATKRDVDLLTK